MKRLTLAVCAAAFLFASCNNEKTEGETTSKDSSGTKMEKMDDNAKKEKAWVPVDSATSMKNWMAYMTPGEVHGMLAKSNGTWTGTSTMWMASGAPPMTSNVTAVNKMVLGGRYQTSAIKGDMMGQPFEGMSTLAYDNFRKVFISTWVDNMGTGLMKMEGAWNDATKSITFTGKMVDPSRGTGEECDFKEVFTIVDDNNQKMEMYGPDPQTGKEFKTMELKMTRKK